jgi:hypothetical protein
VYYNVYNVEKTPKKDLPSVVAHEEEHQKNKILAKVFEEKFEEAKANWLFDDVYKVFKGSGNLSGASVALRSYFEIKTKMALPLRICLVYLLMGRACSTFC